MTSHSRVEVRRCRPLLGTFVEITASGADECRLHHAADAAFSVIDKIHRLMSPHEPGSELSLLNRDGAERAVKVSPDTFEVLRRAHRMADESAGAFDYTIAPTLARWGLLPVELKRKKPGCWRDVLLLSGRRVRFLRPLTIDLGGIAKGFAVDKAIETLRVAGALSGIVNAGGDLRVFGAETSTVHLRHASCPQALARSINIRQAALATSSPCFTEQSWRGQQVSHLVNPLQRKAVTGNLSVTVRARECWLADALTKVVLNEPRIAQRLLTKYEAEAFLFAA